MQTQAAVIAEMMSGVQQATDIDTVRGYEGKGAQAYFEGWRSLVAPEWGFNGRNYYPPKDAVNALLSFGYTFLQSRMHAAIERVGLDPYLGVFHVVTPGRPSLVLDLMEEWRPLIVDGVVLRLIHSRQITLADFDLNPTARYPATIRQDGMERLKTALGTRLAQRTRHPLATGQIPYADALELQVRALYRLLDGTTNEYQPVAHV